MRFIALTERDGGRTIINMDHIIYIREHFLSKTAIVQLTSKPTETYFEEKFSDVEEAIARISESRR